MTDYTALIDRLRDNLAPRSCSVDACNRPYRAKGFCRYHHYRFETHGDPLVSKNRPVGATLRYITDVVIPYKGHDCLTWPYGYFGRGYAAVWKDGRQQGVSRIVCESMHGPPPSPAHAAAHLCGNGSKGCCTPGHIVWKTYAENEADKLAHGTALFGEAHKSAKLTAADVRFIRKNQSIRTGELARMLSVSTTTIRRIKSGQRWPHVTI